MRFPFTLLLLFTLQKFALAHSRLAAVTASYSETDSLGQLRLEFTAPIEVAFSRFQAEPEGGPSTVAFAGPQRNDQAVFLEFVSAQLLPGSYWLRWSILSADGHRQEGKQKFTVLRHGKPPT